MTVVYKPHGVKLKQAEISVYNKNQKCIYFISGPTSRGGRKLDETRDKYGKACRRLHRAHNEYVLLLAEATECERALRTAALPALLEQQRRQGEATATSW